MWKHSKPVQDFDASGSFRSDGADDSEGGDVSATTIKADESAPSAEESEELAKKETQNVFRLRLLVILVLGLTAGVIAYTVFRLTDDAESEEFETQYEAAAEKIIACKSVI